MDSLDSALSQLTVFKTSRENSFTIDAVPADHTQQMNI